MEPNSQNVTSSHENDCTLVIMAKAPRAGMVKTRLAEYLHPTAVLEFYRCLLADTIALAKSLNDVEVAIMCPESDVAEFSRVTSDEVRVVAQTGSGLAAGLTSVFEHFTAGGRRRVVAFNSDSPHLPASRLKSAFKVLLSADLVVGPTHDGGYYLVGATAPHPGLFSDIAMGKMNALEVLLARAHAQKLSLGFTDPFYDIDVAADLSRLAEELRLAPERAPRTAVWLREWELVAAQVRADTGEL